MAVGVRYTRILRAVAFVVATGIVALGIATPAAAFVCEDVVNGDGGGANAVGGAATSNMACGQLSTASSATGTGTAVGTGALVTGNESTSAGSFAAAGGTFTNSFTNDNNTAIGGESQAGTAAAGQTNNTAIGTLAVSNVVSGTALGESSLVTADHSVALGQGSIADRANAVSVGSTAANRQIINVAAGTAGTDAVNLNQLNGLVANFPIAANNANARAAPTATGTDALAAGYGASASQNQATAIGNNSSASGTNSVAVGFGSVATVANTFSVGAVGNERTIVNVAAGSIASGSTDAVNGGQLFTANQRVAAAFGGGAGLDVNGQLTAPTYTIAGTNFNNVGGALTAINTTGTKYFASNSTGPGASAAGTDSVAIGPGATASQANSVAIGSGSTTSAANTVSVGSTGNERRITNVAAGINPTDAVNLGQLNGALTGVQNQIGGLQNQVNSNLMEARGGIATALAASGLHFDERPGKVSLAGAYGNFKGVSGMAVGLGYAATERLRFNATVSGSPDQGSVGAVVAGSVTLN